VLTSIDHDSLSRHGLLCSFVVPPPKYLFDSSPAFGQRKNPRSLAHRYVTTVNPTPKDSKDELEILDLYLAVEEPQQNGQFTMYINAQGVVFP